MTVAATAALPRVPAFILAGGRSRRFGSDKLRHPIAGQPLVCQVAARLGDSVGRVALVTNAVARYADLGLPTIADDGSGRGPLLGLQRALVDLRANETWLLLVGGDMLGIQPSWVDTLVATTTTVPPATQVLLFLSDPLQPLCALYHRGCHSIVSARLAANQLALHSLLDTLVTVRLPAPPDFGALRNVNTPDDLER